MIFELHFNFIVIAFLYANKCIVYDSKISFNFIIMLFTPRFSFYYFLNIKNDFTLLIILNIFSLNISFLIFIKIFNISFILRLNLHFVFIFFLFF